MLYDKINHVKSMNRASFTGESYILSQLPAAELTAAAPGSHRGQKPLASSYL